MCSYGGAGWGWGQSVVQRTLSWERHRPGTVYSTYTLVFDLWCFNVDSVTRKYLQLQPTRYTEYVPQNSILRHSGLAKAVFCWVQWLKLQYASAGNQVWNFNVGEVVDRKNFPHQNWRKTPPIRGSQWAYPDILTLTLTNSIKAEHSSRLGGGGNKVVDRNVFTLWVTDVSSRPWLRPSLIKIGAC